MPFTNYVDMLTSKRGFAISQSKLVNEFYKNFPTPRYPSPVLDFSFYRQNIQLSHFIKHPLLDMVMHPNITLQVDQIRFTLY